MSLVPVIVLFGLTGILFYELFIRLKVLRDIQQVFNVAPAAVKVIRSTTLTDEEKEKSVRRMSLLVLKDTLAFSAKIAFILLICVALASVAQFLFTLSPDGLGALLASWHGLVTAVVAVALYARFKPTAQRAFNEPRSDTTSQYNALDRLLHRLAFFHPRLQKTLGDVENDLFKKQLATVTIQRPVFITGLPRAGTTLLLELLYDTGQFATFTYRQMPFVLNPLLWNRLSKNAHKQGTKQERAHGDGMLVSYDSPEAFEEVLWTSYLGKSLFKDQGMQPLSAADLDDPFREAFVNLARKLVSLNDKHRPADSTTAIRYLSKNNANLSRLDAITSVFSDAELLICYRHPSTHVTSLHTQHLQFLKKHEEDTFARDYMRWIGHHDFGANFRPIRFDRQINLDPNERTFWLQYWIDAYRFVLENAPAQTQFICYESLLENGATDLARLAKTLQLDELTTATLTASASRLRAPGSTADPLQELSPKMATEAQEIYNQLSARSLTQHNAWTSLDANAQPLRRRPSAVSASS